MVLKNIMEINYNNIDVELLIGEVKKFPEIWNIADENYRDMLKKRIAWMNVCKLFSENFDDKLDKEKNEICNKIAKKWRNVRDTYIKNLKKRHKSGQAAETSKTYIYSAQLSFLEITSDRLETQSSQEQSELEDCENLQKSREEKTSKAPRYKKNSSRKRERDMDSSLIEFTGSPIPQPVATPEPNDDRAFFESMLPLVKDFTWQQKIEFRSEILSLAMRANLINTSMSNQFIPYPQSNSFSSNFIPPNAHFSQNYSTSLSPNFISPNPHRLSTPISNMRPTRCSTRISNVRPTRCSTQISNVRPTMCTTPNSNPRSTSYLMPPRCSSPNSVILDNQSNSEDGDMDLFGDP